jgi:hypothetical protein
MKYMTTGSISPLARLSLGLTLLLLGGFWVATALLYMNRMGLAPESVTRYYLGSEAEFMMPRTYGSMLEVTHGHLAMMAVVLLLLTHLAVFFAWPMRTKAVLIIATFGFAVLGEASGWLVRFVSPQFAPLKIVAFLGLEMSLLILLVGLGRFLLQRPDGRRAEGDGEARLALVGSEPQPLDEPTGGKTGRASRR